MAVTKMRPLWSYVQWYYCFYLMCMVGVSTRIHVHHMYAGAGQCQRESDPLKRVPEGFEPPDVGAGNQTLALEAQCMPLITKPSPAP